MEAGSHPVDARPARTGLDWKWVREMRSSLGPIRRPITAAALCLGIALAVTGCGGSGDDAGQGQVQQTKVSSGEPGGGNALAPEEQSGGAGAKRGQ